MRAPLRRLFGFLTLAVFLGSLGLPLLPATHFDWNDDTACGATGFAAGRKDAFSAAKTPPVPQHCAICHWLRAMGAAAPGHVVATGPAIAQPRILSASAINAPDLLLVRHCPSRGPPASSL